MQLQTPKKLILIRLLPALILVLVAMGCIAFILRWEIIDKTIPEVPAHTTYSQAVREELPQYIATQAETRRFGGYVRPLIEINGAHPDGMISDVNLALAAYDGWNINAKEEVKQAMRDRMDDTLDKWGRRIGRRDFLRLINTQKNIAIKTKYSVEVGLLPIEDETVNTRKIEFTLYNENGTEEFSTNVFYTDNERVSEWKQAREQKQQYIDTARRAQESAITVLRYAIAIALVLYMIIAVHYLYVKMVVGRHRKSWLLQIEKRTDLVRDGHFVAAMKLVENYIRYFPHDVEIIAFRDRLRDFCGGDLQKAQEAYVHAKKVTLMMESSTVTSLNPELKEEILSLIPYNKDLQKTYEQYSRLEIAHNSDKAQEIANLTQDILTNVSAKHIEAAKKANERLGTLDPSNADYLRWRALFSSSERNWKLKATHGETIHYIFTKKSVLIGRKDDNLHVDVPFDNSRISRKHLQLSVSEGTFVAEDLQSTNGSYVNGTNITRTGLANNDTINVGKIIDFKCVVSSEKDLVYSLSSSNISIHLVEGNGTITSKHSTETVDWIQGLLIISGSSGGTAQILKSGEAITFLGEEFAVEELT